MQKKHLFWRLFSAYLLVMALSLAGVIIYASSAKDPTYLSLSLFMTFIALTSTAVCLIIFYKTKEPAEEMRRQFVANVSHELRTPITSIKGFIETLLDGAMHDKEEAERFLKIIARQSDRLNAIVEDLLTLSRLEDETEKVGIPLEKTSVNTVLTQAIQVCESKADEKKIQLELNCGEHLEAAINQPLLEQAIVNLVVNAIKFSSEGETIWVEARKEKRETVIHVRDKGCGIDPSHFDRLFERFYRVDKARSRTMGGTGLGLAIVKHIAQLHNGRVYVDSTPGVGSTFSIYLPQA